MQLLNEYTTFRKFWLFIGFQWVLFASVYWIGMIIPDVPPEVELQIQRAEYIEEKLIKRTPDDDDSDIVHGEGNRQSYNLEASILTDYPESLRSVSIAVSK